MSHHEHDESCDHDHDDEFEAIEGEEEDEGSVPDGAAIFPEIPAELNIHPLFLAALHAVVFVAGSAKTIVHPGAAEEALGAMAGYLQRLSGPDLQRAREDVDALVSYAKQQGWPKQLQHFLSSFLSDFEVGVDSES